MDVYRSAFTDVLGFAAFPVLTVRWACSQPARWPWCLPSRCA